MGQNFDSFCRQEYSTVFRAAYALASNRELADDATQDAFGRAFARWHRWRTSRG
jgi:DNA-directed RNA polymerase specialized sigma24 family protein